MNEAEISKLQAALEGAYPTSKISPTKVFDLWRVKRELLEFPNARRADLVNHLLETCKEFPSLPQVLAAMKAVAPQRLIKDSCLICDDTGYIHYEPDGRTSTWNVVATGPGEKPRYKIVPGVGDEDDTKVFAYNGRPIEYAFPRPCPSCSH